MVSQNSSSIKLELYTQLAVHTREIPSSNPFCHNRLMNLRSISKERYNQIRISGISHVVMLYRNKYKIFSPFRLFHDLRITRS